MELFFLGGIIIFVSLFLIFFFLVYPYKSARRLHESVLLPPGRFGWPLVGESLEFLSAGWKGHPENFIFDRLAKYAPSQVFKTFIVGEKMVVMYGAVGNKFLYTNENKYVQSWLPKSLDKIFPSSTSSTYTEVSSKMRKLVSQFFRPEDLQRYIPIMDKVAKHHFVAEWCGKDTVQVFPLTKRCTFLIICRVFMSIEDPTHVDQLMEAYKNLSSGIMSIPINLPGTPYNKAIKSANMVRKKIKEIVKQRKLDLADGMASPTQDILSHMLLTPDEEGKFMGEFEIADKILGLLVAGHDSVSSTCAFVVKFLADLPDIYQGVYKEQMEIIESKGVGELLNWKDIQKMKYSWNVACEVMRLAPPLQGAFREAIADFTYSGFRIPKGWKLYWSAYATHMNPQYFPNPEKFDPSRFDGTGPKPYTYVPFGGGPRMCPGLEFARLEILVFMHHYVRRFKSARIIPNEKMIVNPMPIPEKGLPVRLYPHSQTLVA